MVRARWNEARFMTEDGEHGDVGFVEKSVIFVTHGDFFTWSSGPMSDRISQAEYRNVGCHSGNILATAGHLI